MLMNTTDDDHLAVLAIAGGFAPVSRADFAPLLQSLECRDLAAGEGLLHVGQGDVREFFVLSGLLRLSVGDAQGREVTLGFCDGPGVVPPAITRTRDGRSRVDVTALQPSRVAGFDSALLVATMLRCPAVQRWGDAVLRDELMRKSDREWQLAALPAAERLALLREAMPGLEQRVAHRLVASYLGVTPVTLSRLRRQSGSV